MEGLKTPAALAFKEKNWYHKKQKKDTFHTGPPDGGEIKGELILKVTLTAPCHFGLESVLSSEVRRMDAENAQVTDGRVTFDGDEQMIARANIGLRTAERVQLVLGQFEARSFEELFQGVKRIRWEDYIGRKDAFPVKGGWSLKSQLYSIPDCQSIIKKAIVTRLQQAYGVSWFEESGSTCAVDFSIHHDQVMITMEARSLRPSRRPLQPAASTLPMSIQTPSCMTRSVAPAPC